MINLVAGNSADDVWQKLAEAFRSTQYRPDQPSRAGNTKELLHVGLSVEEPRQRWVVSRNPPLNLAFAIAEVVWIVAGRKDAGFLNYWNSQLPEYAGVDDTYHGAYGFRLRKHLQIDQIQRAYDALKSNPDTRQVVLQIWDSRIDLPLSNGKPVNPDIPCNLLSLLKVRNGTLEWTQIMRSNDLFLGLPHNFVQFTTLQEIMAGWLGIEVGTFNQLSDSLHVYTTHLDYIRASTPVAVARNEDQLSTNKTLSDKLFEELADKIDLISKKTLSRTELEATISWNLAPQPFKNLLYVLMAEGARRRKWTDLANTIMDQCTNPVLQQLWLRWVKETTLKKKIVQSNPC
jgi:thymidylate synthase